MKSVHPRATAAAAFALFIVGPVWLPWRNAGIIIGLGGPNVWHNATNICGRTVGIFAFFLTVQEIRKILDSNYKYVPRVRRCIQLAIVYWISLLAKPSFAQSFVPAFGVYLLGLLLWSKGKALKQFLAFAGTAVPALLYLLLQSAHYFGGGGLMEAKTGQGLVIESIITTGEQFRTHMGNSLLAMAFPLFMFAVSAIHKKLDEYHVTSLLMHLFARLFVIFLRGSAAGEMGWAWYIAVFFVWAIGIRDYLTFFYGENTLLREGKVRGKILYSISTVLLIEHIIVGIYKLYTLIILKAPLF